MQRACPNPSFSGTVISVLRNANLINFAEHIIRTQIALLYPLIPAGASVQRLIKFPLINRIPLVRMALHELNISPEELARLLNQATRFDLPENLFDVGPAVIGDDVVAVVVEDELLASTESHTLAQGSNHPDHTRGME